MLSNSLIHLLSRTRRVLSNVHLLSSIPCSWWLQNAKSHCKIPGFRENLSRFAHKCFPILSFTYSVELDEFYSMDIFSAQFNAPGGYKMRNVTVKYQVFEKTCAIRPEMLSNSLIHFPSRTR